MRLRSLGVLVLGLMAAAASPALAQVSTTGSIQVVLEDQQGGRLPGVTVTAAASDVVTTRTAVSDAEGVATLEALAPSALYTVRATLSGFRDLTRENILVRSGQVTTLHATLTLSTVTEAVTVLGQATPVVDVTRATTGADITLQLTESVPTGRSYQSYLQLVPGVMPDNQLSPGNPAVRSGMNYSDIVRIQGDNAGVSTDNAYYLDGINVTDPVRGTFGANMNTEVIQEQKVITGGIPAEYVGVAGLISNVITKSGSNAFRGSGNYFFQNTDLVSENEHGTNDEFGHHETAFTFGGPALMNKVWFFGSYRYLRRSDTVTAIDNAALVLRQPKRTEHQTFAKGTWGVSSTDLVSFTIMADPLKTTGSRDRNITNERDRRRDQGGPRFAGNYTRVAGNFLIDVSGNRHKADISDFSVIRQPSNTVIFRGSDTRTLAEESLGGYGRDLPEERNTSHVRGSVQYALGNHVFKGGLEWSDTTNLRNTLYIGDAIYESLSSRYVGSGISAGDVAGGGFTVLAFDSTNTSDYTGFIQTVNARADRARYYAAFDLDRNGTISSAELSQALVFNVTAGNPNNQINYDRTFQSQKGAQITGSRGLGFFIQDEFRFDRWTFNVGLRSEQWKHYATNGDNIFTFEWAWAPRLSAVWDVRGDGRQKASVFWGRYFDPIRNDMTNFAGTLGGSILEEQVYALGEWITYRTRGGPVQQDAFFAPTTKTPYTDDLQVSYGIDLGKNQSVEAVYFNRRTRDILEDYDHHLYGDPEVYGGPINHPDSLFLGPQYFGYTTFPEANFFIATLAGGKRDFNGLELVYRKRFERNWQTLVSYNYLDGKGNTNSDGNADFQGDVLFLDPRAPNQFGTQPGVVHHLFKAGGSYNFNFGLQVGATLGWNSGVIGSKTFRASSRHLPVRVSSANAFEFAGITARWIEPGAVGGFENPSYATFDTRVQYVRRIGNYTAEFFVDLFNVFDAQSAIRNMDLVAGLGGVPFGGPIQWVLPFRSFLGARIRF